MDHLKRDFTDVGVFQDFNAGAHIVLNTEYAARQGLSISALSNFSDFQNELNRLAFGYCGNTEREFASGLTILQDLIWC